jgi:hypothetical protein
MENSASTEKKNGKALFHQADLLMQNRWESFEAMQMAKSCANQPAAIACYQAIINSYRRS